MKPTTAHVKGTDLVTIKKLLLNKSDAALEECYKSLSPETMTIFKTVIASIWIPNARATEIMECAARILFPNTPDDLEQLGGACAEHAFTGIYKTFLQFSSVSFLIKRVPLVWTMYHSIGQASVKMNDDNNGALLSVIGAPDVKTNNLRLVGGFSTRALEMAGAKNVLCKLDTSDPSNWCWTFNWQL